MSSFSLKHMPESVEPTAPKDTRFDPYRLPASPKAQALVDEVRKQLLGYEAHRHPRQRKRRKADQAIFDRIVTAIVCDLAHSALGDPAIWRHISMSKRRHANKSVGATFMTEARIKIIQWMSTREMEWLEFRPGIYNPTGLAAAPSQQAAIRASARLLKYMDERDIQYQDLGRDPEHMGDPIVLKGRKVRGKAKALTVPAGEPAKTYRSEMGVINTALAGADVLCTDVDKHGAERDTGDRWLRRIFNDGKLDQGGRLYGGFWQDMSQDDRLQTLLINNEPVASLDFGQCSVRIAYGQVGVEPPAGDLYRVPGLEGYRDGVKTILNAELSKTQAMKRKPMGTAKQFGKSMSLQEIEEPILRHHKPISSLFYTGLGLTLQFIESRVLVLSLRRLLAQGVVALPIHDCLLVARSATEIATQVMLDCFQEIAGVSGVVTAKAAPEVPVPSNPPARVLTDASAWDF